MTDRPPHLDLPVPAATVIFVREEDGKLQVYLLRRSRKAVFMPGMHAFPGGRVDARDRDGHFWGTLVDLRQEALPGALGSDLAPGEALAFGIAALRETFEEAGILLIQDPGGFSEALPDLARLRNAGALPEGWLAEHASRRRWRLALSSLARWSRWVTPPGMKRRYDTVYFLASAPAAQTCQPDGREADAGLWITPDTALARNLRGEVPLSPPTIVTLQELQEYPDLAALERGLLARPSDRTFTPRLVELDGGSVIVEPWDPDFDRPEIRIAAGSLEQKVLPPGAPFSRIWFNGTLWRPVAA
jgi:8-oxo-dGTP pyrophosphatase MutT (NUDIX family)